MLLATNAIVQVHQVQKDLKRTFSQGCIKAQYSKIFKNMHTQKELISKRTAKGKLSDNDEKISHSQPRETSNQFIAASTV